MVVGLVPEDKLVELSPKSSKDLYSILHSLQLSGIFLLKNSKWRDTILVLSYSLLSYFFLLCTFFVETPHKSGALRSPERKGQDKPGNPAFYFPNPKPWMEEKICESRESELNKCGG